MNLRKYIGREIRRAVDRATDRALAIGSKIAVGSVVEGLGIVAFVVGIGCGLSGCHTQKVLPKTEQTTVVEEETPKWHTCLVQNAQGILTLHGQTITANCTMQAVRDSLVVLSIMPMLGIEMVRIEATPEKVIGIDKMNRQYAAMTYDEINSLLSPTLSWSDLQALASGEMPSETEGEAFVGYSAMGQTVMLRVIYPAIQKDVPVRAVHLNLSRYQEKTLTDLLQ